MDKSLLLTVIGVVVGVVGLTVTVWVFGFQVGRWVERLLRLLHVRRGEDPARRPTEATSGALGNPVFVRRMLIRLLALLPLAAVAEATSQQNTEPYITYERRRDVCARGVSFATLRNPNRHQSVRVTIRATIQRGGTSQRVYPVPPGGRSGLGCTRIDRQGVRYEIVGWEVT